MDRGKAKTLAAPVIAAMLPFPVTASSENRTTYEDEMLSPILAIGSLGVRKIGDATPFTASDLINLGRIPRR
jgi:hypothetical protein